MNLGTLGALFLLFAIVNSTPFYVIKDDLLVGDNRIDMQAYDPESPFNGDFVKKGDIYTVRPGKICLADSFTKFTEDCLNIKTNNLEPFVSFILFILL